MNACNPQYFTEKLSLSAGDIISINTLYPEEPEAKIAERQPRIDGCQRCGQDHPDKRYCGIVDPKSGSWQSGTWVPCLNEEKIMNRCQPCGKDKINERFCGQYDGKTWSAGTWVLCTGNNSVPAVAEPVN
jgi:hypothetical protein